MRRTPYFVIALMLSLLCLTPVTARLQNGSLISTGEMHEQRSCHTATLLKDGTVLIAGGMVVERHFLNTAELFDPVRGTFTPTGNMHEVRACHTATLLKDGRVLIAGGSTLAWLATAEVYDPTTKVFTPIMSMHQRRGGFTATLLKDGRVLIVGGSNDVETLTASELFDPVFNTFTLTGDLHTPRAVHTATLLNDGRVLIAGGEIYRGSIYATADLYEPATGTFLPTGAMTVARHKHAAALLPDGNVLLLGGADRSDWRGRLASTEIYDVKNGRFVVASVMTTKRFKFSDAVTSLNDGGILIAGGSSRVEVYDPSLSRIRMVDGSLDTERSYQTATLLTDGRVLIVGGYNLNIEATSHAWLYIP